jgi:hypothetical protein
MTEDQIELWIERAVDGLDRVYLSTAMTRDEYEARLREIDNCRETMRKGKS